MNLKDFLITGHRPPPDGLVDQSVPRDNAGSRKKHQAAYLAGHDARTKESEIQAKREKTPTENALRASELSYRRLFEAAKDGILILDVDTGRINDVNPFPVQAAGFFPG